MCDLPLLDCKIINKDGRTNLQIFDAITNAVYYEDLQVGSFLIKEVITPGVIHIYNILSGNMITRRTYSWDPNGYDVNSKPFKFKMELNPKNISVFAHSRLEEWKCWLRQEREKNFNRNFI